MFASLCLDTNLEGKKSHIPKLLSTELEIKQKNFECIMVNFQSVFLFLSAYDFPSVLNKEISFLKVLAAEHTPT